jgi:hypothetical protein
MTRSFSLAAIATLHACGDGPKWQSSNAKRHNEYGANNAMKY